MAWITARIKWIMLVAGVLTVTMLYAAIAPAAAFQSTFGEPLEGQAAILVVRNWGVLIALVGAMLIYGAYQAGLSVAVDSAFVLIFAVYLVASRRTRGSPP